MAEDVDARAEVLLRADALVSHAVRQLEEQGEQLERLYGLLECLVEVGPPLAVVEGAIVRAWSPALEALTGIRRAAAVSARLSSTLPTLRKTGDDTWCWTAADGSEWMVATHVGQCPYEILRWDRRLEGPAGSSPT